MPVCLCVVCVGVCVHVYVCVVCSMSRCIFAVHVCMYILYNNTYGWLSSGSTYV